MIFGRGHYQKKQAKASPGRLFDVRFRLTFSIYSNLICKERCKSSFTLLLTYYGEKGQLEYQEEEKQ